MTSGLSERHRVCELWMGRAWCRLKLEVDREWRGEEWQEMSLKVVDHKRWQEVLNTMLRGQALCWSHASRESGRERRKSE